MHLTCIILNTIIRSLGDFVAAVADDDVVDDDNDNDDNDDDDDSIGFKRMIIMCRRRISSRQKFLAIRFGRAIFFGSIALLNACNEPDAKSITQVVGCTTTPTTPFPTPLKNPPNPCSFAPSIVNVATPVPRLEPIRLRAPAVPPITFDANDFTPVFRPSANSSGP
ncbi:hypothetical protein DERP_011405 [Dermatophagoides pteronyssinus]|uniref:Uncharacterized protein n=1 Tax=Dermatophagoides pteronyssinus TaxID=6956 RepID=A0ABQ8J542_DERPT|nr:hypothetical protein DERP_011405 [Dermatophagoides pteronyssinus]